MPSWNPDLYLKYAEQRTQPSRDLAARIPLGEAASILDIGCGPGNSTEVIAGRYPGAQRVLGIDFSPEMVEKATASYPDYEFRQWDANGDLSPLGCFDVVFSNACIQWLPNHAGLLPRMLGCVNKGGALAVQLPVNQNEPVQRIVAELVADPAYSTHLAGVRTFARLSAGEYYDILIPLAQEVLLWQTTYIHEMESHAAIIEWYKGTGLRPFLQALPAALATQFEAQVLARVQQAYPTQANGKVLFPFPRLFFIALK